MSIEYLESLEGCGNWSAQVFKNKANCRTPYFFVFDGSRTNASSRLSEHLYAYVFLFAKVALIHTDPDPERIKGAPPRTFVRIKIFLKNFKFSIDFINLLCYNNNVIRKEKQKYKIKKFKKK